MTRDGRSAACDEADCPRAVVAKGLCRTHYNRSRNRAIRAAARAAPRACSRCGAIYFGRTKRAVYCSKACSEAANAERKSAALAAARADQRCRMCGREFTSFTAKARVCSRKCGDDWANQQKQRAKLDQWERDKKPCAFCGGVLGPDRRRGTLYCSRRCKGNALSARQRQRNPGYMRQYLYGLSPERFAAILDAQGGRCAICRTDTPGGKGGWHTDHDHTTKEVRGLLCDRCNRGLGHLHDDPQVIRAAMAYLRDRRGAGRTGEPVSVPEPNA